MAEMLHIDVVVSQTEEWEPTNNIVSRKDITTR